MSSTMDVVYQSALLADAAYVSLHLPGFVTNQLISAEAWDQDASNPDGIVTFADRGFTRQQFDEFQRTYRVLHHQPDTTTGFSATLFENIETGGLHLAFRGTNGLSDAWQDVALATVFADQLGSVLQEGMVDDFLRAANVPGKSSPAKAVAGGSSTVLGTHLC